MDLLISFFLGYLSVSTYTLIMSFTIFMLIAYIFCGCEQKSKAESCYWVDKIRTPCLGHFPLLRFQTCNRKPRTTEQ